MEKGSLRVTRMGVEFVHNGDEIVWLWLWKRRKFNSRFLSIGFGACFKSLKEIDSLWEDYFKASAKEIVWNQKEQQ